MKLFDILKQKGLFSNDIKTRIKNKQISINCDVVAGDLDLDIQTQENPITKEQEAIIIEPGDFLVDLIKISPEISEDEKILREQVLLKFKIFGLENLMNSNIENDLTKKLKQFIFIRLSKKETLMLKKNA